MPAMSPTMTEGGIANWKKKEGEAFEAGDILLEIETDKATMDVEAQDTGIMGKIIVPDGSKAVPVGKTIALLAEEGDDISNLEVPAEDTPTKAAPKESTPPPPSSSSSSSSPASTSPKATEPTSHGAFHPKSSKPLFPSVIRLLQEHNLSADVDSIGIKGTGVRGMLTKGDVLAFLGLAKSPTGTYTPTKPENVVAGSAEKPVKEAPPPPLTGTDVRRLIVAGLAKRVQPVPVPVPEATFDSILADYTSPMGPPRVATPHTPPVPKTPSRDYLEGLI